MPLTYTTSVARIPETWTKSSRNRIIASLNHRLDDVFVERLNNTVEEEEADGSFTEADKVQLAAAMAAAHNTPSFCLDWGLCY
jgi:hypothetical protein